MRTLLVFSLALVAVLANQQVRYDNFKVYRVTPKTAADLTLLKSFESYESDVDFWTSAHNVGQHIDVMVSPNIQNFFVESLKKNEIYYLEIISDVEKVFLEERVRQLEAPKLRSGRISFTQYQRYDTIVNYITGLARSHPELVTVEYPGTSSEGRPLVMAKISTGGTGKPVILVDAGIHAREWIAPAMATYMINQLVENPNNRHLIENVDWYIIPVLNPDGYEYSHTNQRMWRKTRSRGLYCNGVDGNRNFDFHWNEVGTSQDECSDIYSGPKPMSEPEVRTIQSVIEKYGQNIKLYITYHSYGNYLLFPWGYTSALPHDYDELQGLGDAVANAIRSVDGSIYTVGTSTNVLYAAAGGSDDWVKAIGGVELSYTIELPGGGWQGFDLPPDQIIPVGQETWEGIKVYHQHVEQKFVLRRN